MTSQIEFRLVSDAALARHKIFRPQFEALYRSQAGICCCGGERLLDDIEGIAIDHDHSTGKVRGILCRSCNTLLGRLGDDIHTARRTFAKIEKYLAKRAKVNEAILLSQQTRDWSHDALNELLLEKPTWTARCAAMLGFDLVSKGLLGAHNPQRDNPAECHGVSLGRNLDSKIVKAFTA